MCIFLHLLDINFSSLQSNSNIMWTQEDESPSNPSSLESKENSGNVDIPSWNPSPPLFQEKLISFSPWKM